MPEMALKHEANLKIPDRNAVIFGMSTKPKILIVDDEPDIIDILTFLLEREGYAVVTALSGKEGLQKISSESFHAVVSDLSMPEMDGLNLLRHVRARKDHTPFIFLSGYAKSWDEHEMINLGAYELIVKPHVDKVPPALKKLLNTQREIESLKLNEEAPDFMTILHSSNIRVV